MEELAKVKQRHVRTDIAEPPPEEELGEGKAGGESGILPEMLKAACEGKEFLELLMEQVKESAGCLQTDVMQCWYPSPRKVI